MFYTSIDRLFRLVESNKVISIRDISTSLNMPTSSVTKIARYLEKLDILIIDYKNLKGPILKFLKHPDHDFRNFNEQDLIKKLKFLKSFDEVKSANRLLYDLYRYTVKRNDDETKKVYTKIRNYYAKHFMKKTGKSAKDSITELSSYNLDIGKIAIEIKIIKQELEPVPFYVASLLKVSELTQKVIEKIKEDVISNITFHVVFKTHQEEAEERYEYKKRILSIMRDVFPGMNQEKLNVFTDLIIMTSLGMGDVEFLLKDPNLEEIVINRAAEPIWVYHKRYGWLETNIIVDDESSIVHYATLAGRNVDKTITSLSPLMDAHLEKGDRVNATLKPVTSRGNTLTIRKFAEIPWSITDFILKKTISHYAAALVWTAIQYELSVLIVGGTGSGKTSALNVYSIFIPPNQRVISIEDTREIKLPDTLHWVPMETKLANPEGKGEVTMLDLIINSLRMRPDRIIVGEIRRKKEAEVLFEAMHTGHSVIATLHANTVHEAITRMTSEPMGIPKQLLSAVDLILVQNRNRRNNTRRTFQIAEITEDAEYNLLYKHNMKKDILEKVSPPKRLYEKMELFSGLTKSEVDKEINEKIKILQHLTSKNIVDNKEIAMIINYYYVNKDYLMRKLFGD
jgi:archaeal flagellar protein FlaI